MADIEIANYLFIAGMTLRLFILIRHTGKEYCFPEIVSFQTRARAHTHVLDFHQKEKRLYTSRSRLGKIQVASFSTEFIVGCECGHRCRAYS